MIQRVAAEKRKVILELGNRELEKPSRYQKITCDFDKIEQTKTNISLDLLEREGVPNRLIIDVDSTDDIVHGKQEV